MTETGQLLEQIFQIEEKGDIQTALEEAVKLRAAVQTDDPTHIPAVEATLARQMALLGRYVEARQHAERSLQMAPEDPSAVNALIVLGISLAETNHPQEAEEYFQQAAELSRKSNDWLGLGRAMHNLATAVYLPQGKFDLARICINESLRFKEESGSTHWGRAFVSAYIHQITGERERCRLALDELAQYVQPGSRIAGGYFYLWAQLSLDEEELEKAQEYLHLCHRIATATGVPDLNVWARIGYSRYHRLKEEPAVALDWAGEALRWGKRFDSRIHEGSALVEMAQAAWDSSNPHQALQWLEESLQAFEQVNARYDWACAALRKAAWLQQTQSPAAPDAWLQAARVIQQHGYYFLLERERRLAFPLISIYLRSPQSEARTAADNLAHHLEHVAPPPLRISGLGQFSVWQGRRRIPDSVWQRRKAGEVFRYLLIQPLHAASRDEVFEAIWPNASFSTDLLHQTSSTLRHLLEPDLPDKFPSRYLIIEGDRLQLNLPPGSQVDFERFESGLPPAIQEGKTTRIQTILSIYAGELFPTDRYADWSLEARERLRDLYTQGLLALAHLYMTQQKHLDALRCCRTALKVDNVNEEAALLAMQASLARKDTVTAIRLYQKLEQSLQEELAMQPAAELRQLAASIRQGKY